MKEEKQQLLIQLDSILSSKSFSDDVKEKLKNAISMAYDNYTKPKNKGEHFRNVINSIRVVNTFKINTRKQLNKIDDIASHLDDCTLGFVSDDRTMTVIVKNDEEERSIYHELIHLTQPSNAYYVDEKYPFSKFISKCLLEGEATFYDVDLYDNEMLSYENIDMFEGVPNVVFSKGNYPFFYLIYRIMIETFGEDLVDEWKCSKYDIIPKLKSTFEKKYDRSFEDFYMYITKMIYQYFKNNENYSILLYDFGHTIYEIAGKNFEFQQNKDKLEISIESIENYNRKLKEYMQLLENDEKLKKSFEQILEEYIEDNVGLEDLSDLTIENYRNHLLDEIRICKDEISRLSQEYKQLTGIISTQQSDYYCIIDNNFYKDDSKNSFYCYESILTTINKEISDVKLGHLKERTK